jgi:hypothetical protein
MNYKQKLLDPRWQRKRLEILQRDDFRCRFCRNSENTLHVHHLSYQGNPWETPNEHLITLCEDCHEDETHNRKEYESTLLKTLKEKGYPGGFIIDLAAGIYYMEKFHDENIMASVITWALRDKDIMQALTNLYFEKVKHQTNKELATDDMPF